MFIKHENAFYKKTLIGNLTQEQLVMYAEERTDSLGNRFIIKKDKIYYYLVYLKELDKEDLMLLINDTKNDVKIVEKIVKVPCKDDIYKDLFPNSPYKDSFPGINPQKQFPQYPIINDFMGKWDEPGHILYQNDEGVIETIGDGYCCFKKFDK